MKIDFKLDFEVKKAGEMTHMGKYSFFGPPAPIPQPAARKKIPVMSPLGAEKVFLVNVQFQ